MRYINLRFTYFFVTYFYLLAPVVEVWGRTPASQVVSLTAWNLYGVPRRTRYSVTTVCGVTILAHVQ